jgi:hypothetical protein
VCVCVQVSRLEPLRNHVYLRSESSHQVLLLGNKQAAWFRERIQPYLRRTIF